MPDPNNEITKFWPHIATVVTGFFGFIFREKVFAVIKFFLEKIQPEKIKALVEHEKHDDERFFDLKQTMANDKADILQSLQQNIGYLREDLKTQREAAEKRSEFLEKVFLDSRLDKS